MFVCKPNEVYNNLHLRNTIQAEMHDNKIDCYHAFGNLRVGVIYADGHITRYMSKILPMSGFSEILFQNCIDRISTLIK